MNKLFITYFEKHEQLGGAEISTYLIAKKESVENNIYYANSQYKGKEKKITYLKFPKLRYFPFIHTLVTSIYLIYYILRYRIKEIHSHDRLTALPAIISGKITRTSVKVTIRDFWFCCNKSTKYHDGYYCNGSLIDELKNYSIIRWPWEIHKYFSTIITRNLLKTVKVIAISHFIKKELKKYGIKSVVKYNPVNNEQTKKAKKIKKYKDDEIVLYVGRLSEEKGVNILIKAFNKINKKKVKLLIVGSGPEEKKLKKISKNKKIIFVGRVPSEKVYDYYKTAKIIVYPVVWDEPFGRVIAEAKSMNKIIITTKSGGVTEQIKNYKKGYFFKKKDSRELLKLLKKLL